MPRVKIIEGEQAGRFTDITTPEFTIGRDPDCHWQVDLPSVSRHHARIYSTNGAWRIKDLASANGTKRNGREIDDSELMDGDRVAIGDIPVLFENVDRRAPAAPVVSDEADIQATVKEMSRKTKLIEAEISKAIIGQKQVILQLLTAVISKGHVLMIGMPGLAKTLMISTLANVLDLKFRRIQFTPDLMPSDITGTDVLEVDEKTGHKEYRFIKGPIFTNILLADEINRTPPKTQAALLEAMQEQRVTASGHTYHLDLPFFVLATQNPLEQEGTYPLPEAQLDRFMFSVYIDYPTESEEELIAKVTTGQRQVDLKKVLTGAEILKLQDVVRGMPVSDHVVKYATRLVRATRPGDERAPDFIKKWIHCGAGPRASQFLVIAAKANAVIDGRLLVTVDDVRAAARAVLRHRMFTNFTADSEGMDTDKIVQKLVETVTEPGEKDY
ncbi:MAG: AAA family ATPase [Verrucomicrobiota bacterium]